MLNQSPGKQRGKKNTVFKQALLVIVILIASASCSYETPGDLKTGSAKSAAIVGKIGLLEQELADSVKNGDDVKIGRILDKLEPLQDSYYRTRSKALKKERAGLSADQKDREIEIPKELTVLAKQHQIQKYRREAAENSRAAAGDEAAIRNTLLELYISRLMIEIKLEQTYDVDEIEKTRDLLMEKQMEIYTWERKESSALMEKLRKELREEEPGDRKILLRFLKEADRYYDYDYYIELADLELECDKIRKEGIYKNNGEESWMIDNNAKLMELNKRIRSLRDSISSTNSRAIREVYMMGRKDDLSYKEPFYSRIWRRLKG